MVALGIGMVQVLELRRHLLLSLVTAQDMLAEAEAEVDVGMILVLKLINIGRVELEALEVAELEVVGV